MHGPHLIGFFEGYISHWLICHEIRNEEGVNAPRLKVFGLLFGFHSDILHQYGGSTIVVFDCNFLLVAYKAERSVSTIDTN